jgi:ATP-dependent protease ClpP protease subunit
VKYLCFEEKISEETVDGLLLSLQRPDAPQCVYVSSPGGRFDFFSSRAPSIERRGIITLAGDVYSAAIILFLLGRSRRAFPSATFFFHEVRTLINGHAVTICDVEMVRRYFEDEVMAEKREVIEEWLRRMRAAQGWFLSFMKEQTGIPTATLLNFMRSKATLSAREALHYGIIHEIVPEDEYLPADEEE